MASEKELLSTEIVNRGVIEDSGPYAGSLSFSVRVRRGLPDFLNSVNLKYVKLGYAYLLSHGIYFATAPVILVAILGAGLGKKPTWEDLYSKCDFTNTIYLIGFLCFIVFVYLQFTPPSTYLLDFACYRPPDELKVRNYSQKL